MAAPTDTLAREPTIGVVLRRPHVAATLATSVLARLPYGAMSLLTVLRVVESGYSYAQAGIVAAAYAAAIAVGMPVLSRLVDRDGQTRVLTITAVTGGAATVLLALMPSSSPLAVFVALAAVNGALQPPLGGVMRALWDQMLDHDDERHVGYSLDAIGVELVFTGGPLVLVGGVAAIGGPVAGLLASAALTAVGTLFLAASAPSRGWTPSPAQRASLFGPLHAPGVRTLMIVAFGCGSSFGMLELGVTAYGRAEGALGLVGVLLAMWSVGSMVGGLAIARASAARRPGARIAVFLLAMAAGNAVLGLAGAPWVLALLLLLAGASIAPTMATANGAMGHAAPPGMLTEAFGWSLSSIMVGVVLGSPAAGVLVDHVSVHAALAASAVPPALAAAAVWLRRGTLHEA